MVDEQWLTTSEVLERLKISRTLLRQLMENGSLPYKNIGQGVPLYRFSAQEVDIFMKQS